LAVVSRGAPGFWRARLGVTDKTDRSRRSRAPRAHRAPRSNAVDLGWRVIRV